MDADIPWPRLNTLLHIYIFRNTMIPREKTNADLMLVRDFMSPFLQPISTYQRRDLNL
jgi:hypothetical protein